MNRDSKILASARATAHGRFNATDCTPQPDFSEGRPMQVHCENGQWLIGRNFKQIDAGGMSGSLSRSANRVRTTFESWTGDRWVISRPMALVFTTREEAEEYLAANWNRLAELE